MAIKGSARQITKISLVIIFGMRLYKIDNTAINVNVKTKLNMCYKEMQFMSGTLSREYTIVIYVSSYLCAVHLLVESMYSPPATILLTGK